MSRPRLAKIGRGAFATAYLYVGENPVFVTTHHPGHGKDVAAAAHVARPENPHLPAVRAVAEDVWMMPFYDRLSKGSEAWRQFILIRKCADEALAALGSNEVGSLLNRYTILRARARGVDEVLVEALEALASEAAVRSEHYVFEFAPRNVGVDEKGRLVLLDALYDEVEFKKLCRKRRRRRRGR